MVKQEGGEGPLGTQAGEATSFKQEEVKVKTERKALTLKERLEVCQTTERQRLTFCKVLPLLSCSSHTIPQEMFASWYLSLKMMWGYTRLSRASISIFCAEMLLGGSDPQYIDCKLSLDSSSIICISSA